MGGYTRRISVQLLGNQRPFVGKTYTHATIELFSMQSVPNGYKNDIVQSSVGSCVEAVSNTSTIALRVVEVTKR
jgi:hypothetical protein